jgi:hypothetical protein
MAAGIGFLKWLWIPSRALRKSPALINPRGRDSCVKSFGLFGLYRACRF